MTEAVDKLSPVHEQMIDFMVATPNAKAEDIAKHFKYSVSFVRALTATPLFRQRLYERQALVSAANAQAISAKLQKLGQEVLDALLTKVKVEQKSENLVEIAELALKGTGHIVPKGQAAPATVHNSQDIHLHAVDPQLLAAARARMLGLQAPKLINGPELPQG